MKNMSVQKKVVSVDQMLSNPRIFLSQLYRGIHSDLKKKKNLIKRNFKSCNESMLLSLNVKEKPEKEESARDKTRVNIKRSLCDLDKIRTDVESLLTSNKGFKNILKEINTKRISLSDFPLILKVILEAVDEKGKLIENMKNIIKLNTVKINALENKLKISKKEVESKSIQIEDMKRQCGLMLSKVKESLNLKEERQSNKSFKSQMSSLGKAIRILESNSSNEPSLDETSNTKREVQIDTEIKHFIREVFNTVKPSTNKIENLEEILTIIKGWMIERDECGKILLLRNNLCRVLYGDNNTATDSEIVFKCLN